MIVDTMMTVLNLLHIRMAESDGKTIRLDINSVPIILIPSTTVIAVRSASIIFYISLFVPVALAKFSSKVTANILG